MGDWSSDVCSSRSTLFPYTTLFRSETDSDVARYSTLAKNDQMFAAKYKLYLPDKEDLRREIERQKELYLMAHPEENDKE